MSRTVLFGCYLQPAVPVGTVLKIGVQQTYIRLANGSINIRVVSNLQVNHTDVLFFFVSRRFHGQLLVFPLNEEYFLCNTIYDLNLKSKERSAQKSYFSE